MIKNVSHSKDEYQKELLNYQNKFFQNLGDYKEILKNSEIDIFINCEDCS
jgi:hypothetical protein